MPKIDNHIKTGQSDKGPLVLSGGDIIKKVFHLSGAEALNMILDHDNPLQLVREMNRTDLFWLIKKIGEDDSLSLLSLASIDQWQYIMDMEMWQRDRFDLQEGFTWLNRLFKADPERLFEWLLGEEGEMLANFYFSRTIEIIIKGADEDLRIPEGFFTLDNNYFINILDKEHEEEIQQIIEKMAGSDYNRFQTFIFNVAGALPSEVEEEMYRLKNIRLAEDGYLPFEEAISVYSYQKADIIKKDESEYKLYLPDKGEGGYLIPVLPLTNVHDQNIFKDSIERITDKVLLDRLSLEFAGLCNQIMSADGTDFKGIDTLIRICRKTAGYINVGLERLSEGNRENAMQFVRNNPLLSIFRIGFSASLELRWEAERWSKNSWFSNQGFEAHFWGDEWGNVLKGILTKKPLYFSGSHEKSEFREFEYLSELEHSRDILRRIILLDRLLESILSNHIWDEKIRKDPFLTFHPVIINYWAHGFMSGKPEFKYMSIEKARDLLNLLRYGGSGPPYRMDRYRGLFIEDLVSDGIFPSSDDATLLKTTLSDLWRDFSEEYSMVDTSELDPRFSKYILVFPLS